MRPWRPAVDLSRDGPRSLRGIAVRGREGESGLGFRVIGASKLATALVLGAAGFGIFRLMNRDLGEALEHFASDFTSTRRTGSSMKSPTVPPGSIVRT